MRFLILALLQCALLSSHTAWAAVTPEQSLDDDLSGPAVDWLGEIVDVRAQGDDTCFILNRVTELDYRYAQTATRFVTCSPGGFDEQAFAPGKVLEVQGNLGAALPRNIGGQDLTIALVAAPRLTPQSDSPEASAPYSYYGYGGPYGPYPYGPYPYGPYYGPYDPFYNPGFGFGFGFHSHHRRRW